MLYIMLNCVQCLSDICVVRLAAHISVGRAETAVASEGDKFKLAAMGAAVHGTAKSWIATVDHLVNIFHLSRSGMKSIFDFFIIVCKDSLYNVHTAIMHENIEKRNPYSLKIEGQGS